MRSLIRKVINKVTFKTYPYYYINSFEINIKSITMPRKSSKNLKNQTAEDASVTCIQTRSQKRKEQPDANRTTAAAKQCKLDANKTVAAAKQRKQDSNKATAAAKQPEPEPATVNVEIELVDIPSSSSASTSSSVDQIDTDVISNEASIDDIHNVGNYIDPDITNPTFYTMDALCDNINFLELRPFATRHYWTYMNSVIYSVDMDETRQFEDLQLPFEFDEEIVDVSDGE